jgi:GntR family transcriptional regulator
MTQPPRFGPDGEIMLAYEEVAADLAARIRAGEFPPRSRLPGEIALKEEYGRSLSTVRKAVGLLRERGLVRTRAPLGTFVASELPPEPPAA